MAANLSREELETSPALDDRRIDALVAFLKTLTTGATSTCSNNAPTEHRGVPRDDPTMHGPETDFCRLSH